MSGQGEARKVVDKTPCRCEEGCGCCKARREAAALVRADKGRDDLSAGEKKP